MLSGTYISRSQWLLGRSEQAKAEAEIARNMAAQMAAHPGVIVTGEVTYSDGIVEKIIHGQTLSKRIIDKR